MGIILENKVIQNGFFSKNVNNKKCAPKLVFFNEKNQKDSNYFLQENLTLKVICCHFLTPPHYFNSFVYSYFLPKIFIILCPFLKNSTTGIAIPCRLPYYWQVLHYTVERVAHSSACEFHFWPLCCRSPESKILWDFEYKG